MQKSEVRHKQWKIADSLFSYLMTGNILVGQINDIIQVCGIDADGYTVAKFLERSESMPHSPFFIQRKYSKTSTNHCLNYRIKLKTSWMNIFPLPFEKLQCTTMGYDYHSTFGIAWDSSPLQKVTPVISEWMRSLPGRPAPNGWDILLQRRSCGSCQRSHLHVLKNRFHHGRGRISVRRSHEARNRTGTECAVSRETLPTPACTAWNPHWSRTGRNWVMPASNGCPKAISSEQHRIRSMLGDDTRGGRVFLVVHRDRMSCRSGLSMRNFLPNRPVLPWVPASYLHQITGSGGCIII